MPGIATVRAVSRRQTRLAESRAVVLRDITQRRLRFGLKLQIEARAHDLA